MPDRLAELGEELARNPSSLAFLELAEALRRRGDLEAARRVALHGLERHPHRADAHALYGRVLVDFGDATAARDEWAMALRLDPAHVGAHLGVAFLAFREGKLDAAEEALLQAQGSAPGDAMLEGALAHVRSARAERSAAENPEAGLAQQLEDTNAEALLLDGAGLVLAGVLRDADGRDVSADVGGIIAGVADEARWAAQHLGIGGWRELVVEGTDAAMALVPAGDDGLLVVASRDGMPLGRLRRLVVSIVDALGGGGR